MKSGDSHPALDRYVALLREWAPRLDLVAAGELDVLRARHIDDSLRLLPLLERLPDGPCVDVGSGAGFPGIPLAIASGRPWRLVEPRKRRAAFLDEVVRRLELDCEVVVRRVEELHSDATFARAHVFATARALAPPAEALSLLAPLLSATGVGALFIGAQSEPPPGSRLWRPGIAIFGGDTSEGKLM